MPIQNIKLIAVAPMNMLQAEIYEYAFVLLGAIGFAGIVMFISAAVSSTDILRTNTFRILGKLIWSPYLLITIPVLIGILCMPFAIKSWSRRMKA